MARDGAWLVTGGCGFIGKTLVKNLVEQGVQDICVLDSLVASSAEDLLNWVPGDWQILDSSKADSINVDGLQLLKGDMIDEKVCRLGVAGRANIVHLAAMPSVPKSIENPRYDFINSAGITFNLLEAVRELESKPRIVIASSSAAVGIGGIPVTENLVPEPVSPYGAGKLACEAYGLAFAHAYHLNVGLMRFSNVFGPGSNTKESVVAKMISNLCAGMPLMVNGDGLQTRDLIFVDDLVQGIVAVIAESNGGQVFQIGTGVETRIIDIAAELARIWTKMTTMEVAVSHAPERLGDVKRSFSDIAKIRNTTGWEPRVNLSEGLRRTVEWWLAEHPCQS